jgi:hypothetical protein
MGITHFTIVTDSKGKVCSSQGYAFGQ